MKNIIAVRGKCKMNVNVEFFGTEAIENVITSMHFKFGKTLFFGYQHEIELMRKSTDQFLKSRCGVGEVSYVYLPADDMPKTMELMRKEIQKEIKAGNQLYFDITGGESLVLVAFGMLSTEFDSPMHMYKVNKDRLILLDEGASRTISKSVPEQNVRLTVADAIKLKGGCINDFMHKATKRDDVDVTMVNDLWNISQEYKSYWNVFCMFVGENMKEDENNVVNENANSIVSKLKDNKNSMKEPRQLTNILKALAEKSLIENLVCAEGRYSFRYANDFVKGCIKEAGCLLELHTYCYMKSRSEECFVGEYIDWDGVIHKKSGEDVVNEIDVLSISNNVLTFISCKNGKMNSQTALHALYELQTVADRFGGKYAKKILVARKGLTGVYLERAKEMGIKVVQSLD